MPDEVDAAQDAADQHNATALAAHRSDQERLARQARISESMRPRVPDAERRCTCCLELIGAARLKLLSCTGLCTACATEMEKLLKKDMCL